MAKSKLPNRDELIQRAFPLVALMARYFRSLPHGVTVDDLESVGNETLLVAATEYEGDGGGWMRFAKYYLRNKMQAFITAARKRAGRRATMDVEMPNGDSCPRPDPRSADPGELAAVREQFGYMGTAATGGRSIRDQIASLPPPTAVAERVAKLRDTMYGAIDEGRVEAMMQTLQTRAVAGDMKAIKMVMDMLDPARSAKPIQQQAVVIQRGDLD